jgi:hypothetical protein
MRGNHEILFLFVGFILYAGAAFGEHPHLNAAARPQCTTFSEGISPAQLKVIVGLFANREHRIMHSLWHASRAVTGDEEKKNIATFYGDRWLTPATSKLCPLPDSDPQAADYNTYGEDFLFMHRAMVDLVRENLIKNNLPCIASWKEIPAVTDPNWPLTGNRVGPKSDAAYYQLKVWELALRDPKYLEARSLSRLGTAIELSIHNNMHMRWASDNPPRGFENAPPELPLNAVFPHGWVFDSPAYNWLADPYSAAINPVFWKLHGLVDDMIDRWLAAHGKKNIAPRCGDKNQEDLDCYAWRGTWTGGPLSPAPRAPLNSGPNNPDLIAKSGRAIQAAREQGFRLGTLTPETLKDLGHDLAAPSNRTFSAPKARMVSVDDFVERMACQGRR